MFDLTTIQLRNELAMMQHRIKQAGVPYKPQMNVLTDSLNAASIQTGVHPVAILDHASKFSHLTYYPRKKT